MAREGAFHVSREKKGINNAPGGLVFHSYRRRWFITAWNLPDLLGQMALIVNQCSYLFDSPACLTNNSDYDVMALPIIPIDEKWSEDYNIIEFCLPKELWCTQQAGLAW
ncbi:MAG: hypothetical protein HQL81_02570 [Magnetococcales bacterium]|nr:hypothetical protein [Magnetococcales bacterium]